MFFILVSFLLADPLHRVPDTTNVYRQFDPAVLAVASSADLARKYAENLQKAPGQIDGGWVEDYKGYRVFLAGYRNFVEKAAEQLIALFKEHVLQPQRLAREKNEKRKISDEETKAREKIAGEESYDKSQITEAFRKIIMAQKEWDQKCALTTKKFEAREQYERNELLERNKIELNAIFENKEIELACHAIEKHNDKSTEEDPASQSPSDAPSSSSWFRFFEADQYPSPDSNTAEVSGSTLKEVMFCAELSDAAYKIAKKQEISPDLQKAREDWKLRPFGDDGFVLHGEDDTIYVVYKGTSTTTNALTDLKFTPNRDGFHSGIASDYGRTAANMLGILEDIRRKNNWSAEELSKHLVFTGHSLGGGLAQVAAFRWKEKNRNHPDGPRVVTFAAPTVMTDSKAKQYDEEFGMRNNTLTVVQAGDPVPVINPAGTSVGKNLPVPYSQLHFWHQMAGYMMALGALDQAGTIKTERSCLGRWLHWSNVPLSFSFR